MQDLILRLGLFCHMKPSLLPRLSQRPLATPARRGQSRRVAYLAHLAYLNVCVLAYLAYPSYLNVCVLAYLAYLAYLALSYVAVARAVLSPLGHANAKSLPGCFGKHVWAVPLGAGNEPLAVRHACSVC